MQLERARTDSAAADYLHVDAAYVERYAWKRNAEGGQAIGNLQEIRPYTRETVDLCSEPRDLLEHIRASHTFQPPAWISIVSKDGGQSWHLFRVRVDIDELRPDGYKFELGWVVKVEEFSSEIAQQHIAKADSDPPLAVPVSSSNFYGRTRRRRG